MYILLFIQINIQGFTSGLTCLKRQVPLDVDIISLLIHQIKEEKTKTTKTLKVYILPGKTHIILHLYIKCYLHNRTLNVTNHITAFKL